MNLKQVMHLKDQKLFIVKVAINKRFYDIIYEYEKDYDYRAYWFR